MVDRLEVLHDVVEPVVEAEGASLYDLQNQSGVVRVLVERDEGIDLDTIAELSRSISRALDEADPISGRYTLEVSSPGLERPLRTAEHFRRAVGEDVTIRLRAPVDGTRRIRGPLTAVDEETVEVESDDGTGRRTVRLDQVQKARTVFVWERGDDRSDPKQRKATT